ncbi:MAG: Kelch repeat-containing protein [bacterium]
MRKNLYCAIAILLMISSISCRRNITDAPLAVTDAYGVIAPIGSMSTARAAHTATLLPNGKILITGGIDDLATAEIYDPDSKTFTRTSPMNATRAGHAATLLPNGKVFIVGGYSSAVGADLASAEIYDPATGRFTPTGPMSTAREGGGAILLRNGKVLVTAGGIAGISNAELYDPAIGSFAPAGNMTTARAAHTMTMLQDGRILIIGGHRGRRSTIVIHASAEIYDPTTGTFTATGNMTTRRHKHDAVPLPDGQVLVNGGSDERDDQAAYASAEIYNPATGAFRAIGEMPTIRYKHGGTSILLPSGKALIAGGAINAVIYDPQTNAFSVVAGTLGTNRLSRLASTATLLPNGEVLIAGGYGLGQNVSAGAWVYRP